MTHIYSSSPDEYIQKYDGDYARILKSEDAWEVIHVSGEDTDTGCVLYAEGIDGKGFDRWSDEDAYEGISVQDIIEALQAKNWQAIDFSIKRGFFKVHPEHM